MKKQEIRLIHVGIGEKGKLFFDKPLKTAEEYDRLIGSYSQTIQDEPYNAFEYYKRGEAYVY